MKNKLVLFWVFLALFTINLVKAEEPESAPQEVPPNTNTFKVIAQTTDIPNKSTGASQAAFTKTPGQTKISLDIKGMDIVDVLKMLANRSGMNIVVGKNVTGRVTLFLKDVSVIDAFEIILLATDLAYETTQDIITVMTQRDYELLYGERFKDKKEVKIIQLKYAKAADLSRALNQIKTNIGKVVADEVSNTIYLIDTPEKIRDMDNFIKNTDLPIQTKVFSLNYAQAEKLLPKLQEIITKGIGSIRIDERTNKIAVSDYPAKLTEISNIIKAFDEKTPQVLISAQIIELKPTDKFEMGVDWEYWIKKHFRVSSALPIGTGSRLLLGTYASAPAEKGEYKAILDLLRTIGDTKILSSPRIIAINNQEAKILVGTKDAYITSSTTQQSGTAVTSQTVNFVDVGIKLYVTPTINREGFVTMKIRPEISSAERTSITSDGKITEVPIVTTSEAETTVMVKDGVTIIIGGLRKDEKSKTVKKIPGVGDIPGVGFFFRSTSDQTSNAELVILLTPHIMSGETSFTEVSDKKPIDGAMAKMEKGNIILEREITPVEDKNFFDNGSEYYKIVIDKITAFASFNEESKSEKGTIEVEFTISKDGNLINEPNVLKTTNTALNAFAIKAIKDSSPFPPFPKTLKKNQQSFKTALEYE